MLEAELGFKGERGLSNYEIAVKNGYTGTEQEWLANFGVDFNVCVMNDDIAVINMEVDMDDPNYFFLINIPYPEGFNVNNSIVLCKKEKASTQLDWMVNWLWPKSNLWSADPYSSKIWLGQNVIQYANEYYDMVGTGVQDDNKYDVQIALMKVNIPTPPWNPFEE